MTKEGMGDEAMKKSLFYRAKKMPPSAQIMLLFAVEGVFLQYITSINGFGLNLYATNMGATDSQIGIIQMVPNIVACAALLPLGILADRLKSTKTIPMLTLLVMCAGYAFLGSVPALGERRMELFLVSLAFTAGALAIYNAQWQAMFGAAVSLRQRNDVYAFRNQFMFVIGILAPVICGILMGRCHTADGKLLVLRSFFYLCAVCVLLQAAAIKKIPVEQQEEGKAPAEAGKASSRFSVSDLLEAITSVGKNKALRWFFVPVVFFYITAGFSVQNEKSQIVLNTSINSISCVPFSILPMIYQYFWRVRLAKIGYQNEEKIKMSDLLTCEFNIDTACVELCFADGSMISIDCTAVENEVADNMYQRSELDYLIYNDPVAYANLILNGDPETYLKTVTEYNPLD